MKKKSSAAPLIVTLALVAAVAAGIILYLKLAPAGAGGLSQTEGSANGPLAEHTEPGLWQAADTPDDATATISTAEGDIVIKLSDTAAAGSFSEMAKEYGGYTQFFRFVPDMYAQISAPGPVAIEYEETGLWCFRGAVGFVCDDSGVTADIFIVTAPEELSAQSAAYLAENGYSDEVAAAYRELGGVPELDGKHLVFGQVVSGWGPLSRMMKMETGGVSGGYAALSPVDILSITLSTDEAASAGSSGDSE